MKTTSSPLVSVVLPTYNRAHSIFRAIDSVLKQTFTNFELIVVDDGSSDQTKSIINAFNDPRLSYIQHKHNKGVSAARNTGIKLSKGKWIAFQDSDDEWYPQKLEKKLAAAEKLDGKIAVIYCAYHKVYPRKRYVIPDYKEKKKEGDLYQELLMGNFIGTPTIFVPRECFNRVGMFDADFTTFEDWDIWLRLARHYKFQFIAEPLLVSYYTPYGVNESPAKQTLAAFELIFRKNHQAYLNNPKAYSEMKYQIGHLLCQVGSASLGRSYLIESVKTNFNGKSILAFLLSFTGKGNYNKLLSKIRASRK